MRFNEDDLRDQGRGTVGVTGMRFKYDGRLRQGHRGLRPAARLLVAREDGIGKRTPFEDYRLTSRGGTGVIAIDLPEDGSVNVAGALSVHDNDEVMLLTAKGQSIRTRVERNPRDRPRRQGREARHPRRRRQAARHRPHRRNGRRDRSPGRRHHASRDARRLIGNARSKNLLLASAIHRSEESVLADANGSASFARIIKA